MNSLNAVAQSMAAYVGCIAGAIKIEDYRQGLLEAGFAHVEIVDSGADLNAYAKVENQAGCCSPSMDTTNPLQVIEAACCTPATSSIGDFARRIDDVAFTVRRECCSGQREGLCGET